MGLVLLVGAVGIALGLQGWNSRGMNFDLLIFIESAHDLISKGILPDRGDISSYASFSTPGTAWFMVPGVLLFDDPRLYEIVGSAGLYVGTLLGIFLLTRMCFGTGCAYLSILLYGLSRNGLLFAGTLWSIGHPIFYVWMVYFCIYWVRRKDSIYLAAAIITWSAGMYVDMALAPALFIFPVIWLIYRPPVRVGALLMAGALVFALWYPYLRFQVSRNFADVRSMVLREKIFPANYKDSWCVPTLVQQRWEEAAIASNATTDNRQSWQVGSWYLNLRESAILRLEVVWEGLLVNFQQMTYFPTVSFALLVLVLFALVRMCLLPFVGTAGIIEHERIWRYWILRVSCIMLMAGLFLNEFLIARFLSSDGVLEKSTILTIRWLEALIACSATVLLMQKSKIASLLNRNLTIPINLRVYFAQRPEPATLLALGLLVPWFVLLMVAEPGRPERYWWIWPLQVVILVSAVAHFPLPFRSSRLIARAGTVALILLLLINPWLVSHIQSWLRTGWSGPTAKQVEAIDFIGNQLRSERRNKAAVGYQIFTYGFDAKYNLIDPRYKVGAQLDLLLKYQHGITNTTRCAEGVSASDEYRIVQTRSRPIHSIKDFLDEPPQEYFDIPLHGNFQLVWNFEDYQLFRRIDGLKLEPFSPGSNFRGPG